MIDRPWGSYTSSHVSNGSTADCLAGDKGTAGKEVLELSGVEVKNA
jgi:hypothetical protein